MVTTDTIIDFLKDKIGTGAIKADSDLYPDLGVYGDDFDELISDYSKKFTVNMDKYLWYFHTTEEGGQWSIGGLFFTPPYKRIQRIPVTPKMLTEFANNAQWDIDYPEHKLPKRRWDILINHLVSLRSAGQAAGPAYAKRFGRAGNARLRKPATSPTQMLAARRYQKSTF